MGDVQEEINEIIKNIISKDCDTLLKAIIESFDVDTHEEPIFEMCFKNGKLKCAKMIFDKGISNFRLSSCIGSSYDLSKMSLEQLDFLIDYCKVDVACFPNEMLKNYYVHFNKPEPKELKKKKCCAIL